MKTKALPLLVLLLLLVGGLTSTLAQSPFTYQGRLTVGGVPATGTYDLQFQLFDAPSSGSQVGNPITKSGVQVNNGLFTTVVDFGSNIFTGPGRWLEISVKASGSPDSFATLSGRQSLTPTPYAHFAQTARSVVDGAITGSKLADNSVGSAKLQNGAITADKFPASLTLPQGVTVPTANLSGTLLDSQLPAIVLRKDASGNLVLNGSVSASAFTGGGAGLSGLNASSLATGIVPDDRLSANVLRLNPGSQSLSLNAPSGVTVNTLSGGNPVAIWTLDSAGNVSASGSISAATFQGSGAQLTGLPANQLTGTLPAGVNVSVANLTSGTWPTAVFVPPGQLSLGSLPSSVSVPTGNLVGTIPNDRLGSNIPRLDAANNLSILGTVSGASFSGSGANLTSLNPGNLAPGTLASGVTVPDAALSANVLKLDPALQSLSFNAPGGVTINTLSSGNPVAILALDGTGNVTASGAVSAVTFHGSGAELTGLPANQLTGSFSPGFQLPANQLTGSLPPGMSVPVANLTSGTWPTSVFVPANQLGSGSLATSVTVQDASLSANIPKLNSTAAQTFSGDVSVAAGHQFTGTGSGLTDLNAENLITGTVPDARLGNNIPRKDASGNLTLGTAQEPATLTVATIASNADAQSNAGQTLLTLTGNTQISGELNVSGNAEVSGTLSAFQIAGTSLSIGTGTIQAGNITGTALNIGSGTIQAGNITGTALNLGSGAITSGPITSGELTVTSGGLTVTGNTELHAGLSVSGNGGFSGNVTATGALSGASLSINNNAATISAAGEISGTSLNLDSDAAPPTGGGITAISLSIGGQEATIDSAGNIKGNSLDVGSSIVIDSSRNITASSLDLGASGTITAGSITGTSLNLNGASLSASGSTFTITAPNSTGQYLSLDSGGDLTVSSGTVTAQGFSGDGATLVNIKPGSLASGALATGVTVPDTALSANVVKLGSAAELTVNATGGALIKTGDDGAGTNYGLTLGSNGDSVDIVSRGSINLDLLTPGLPLGDNASLSFGGSGISLAGISGGSPFSLSLGNGDGSLFISAPGGISLDSTGGVSLSLNGNSAILSGGVGGRLTVDANATSLLGPNSNGGSLLIDNSSATLSVVGGSVTLDNTGTSVSGNLTAGGTLKANSLDLSGGSLSLSDGSGSNWLSVGAPGPPAIDGTKVTIGESGDASTSLTVHGGVTASTFTGAGAGLTGLNPANLASGTLATGVTVPDAALSANVVKLDASSVLMVNATGGATIKTGDSGAGTSYGLTLGSTAGSLSSIVSPDSIFLEVQPPGVVGQSTHLSVDSNGFSVAGIDSNGTFGLSLGNGGRSLTIDANDGIDFGTMSDGTHSLSASLDSSGFFINGNDSSGNSFDFRLGAPPGDNDGETGDDAELTVNTQGAITLSSSAGSLYLDGSGVRLTRLSDAGPPLALRLDDSGASVDGKLVVNGSLAANSIDLTSTSPPGAILSGRILITATPSPNGPFNISLSEDGRISAKGDVTVVDSGGTTKVKLATDGAITGTALNLGGGAVSMTASGDTSIAGPLTIRTLLNTALEINPGLGGATATITSAGAITGTSLIASGNGAITGGPITGTSVTSSGAVKVNAGGVEKVTLGTDGQITTKGGDIILLDSGGDQKVRISSSSGDISGRSLSLSDGTGNNRFSAALTSSGSEIGTTVTIGKATDSLTDLTVHGGVTASTFTGDGAGLTELNPANLATGTLANSVTVPDAALSDKVVKLDTASALTVNATGGATIKTGDDGSGTNYGLTLGSNGGSVSQLASPTGISLYFLTPGNAGPSNSLSLGSSGISLDGADSSGQWFGLNLGRSLTIDANDGIDFGIMSNGTQSLSASLDSSGFFINGTDTSGNPFDFAMSDEGSGGVLRVKAPHQIDLSLDGDTLLNILDGSVTLSYAADSNLNLNANGVTINGPSATLTLDSSGTSVSGDLNVNGTVEALSLDLSSGSTLGSITSGTIAIKDIPDSPDKITLGADGTITAPMITSNFDDPENPGTKLLTITGNASVSGRLKLTSNLDADGNVSAGGYLAGAFLDINGGNATISSGGDIIGSSLNLNNGPPLSGRNRFSTQTTLSSGIDVGTTVTIGEGTDTSTSLTVHGGVTASTFTGAGAGLTGLNPANLASGTLATGVTVPDTALSANVAKLDASSVLAVNSTGGATIKTGEFGTGGIYGLTLGANGGPVNLVSQDSISLDYLTPGSPGPSASVYLSSSGFELDGRDSSGNSYGLGLGNGGRWLSVNAPDGVTFATMSNPSSGNQALDVSFDLKGFSIEGTDSNGNSFDLSLQSDGPTGDAEVTVNTQGTISLASSTGSLQLDSNGVQLSDGGSSTLWLDSSGTSVDGDLTVNGTLKPNSIDLTSSPQAGGTITSGAISIKDGTGNPDKITLGTDGTITAPTITSNVDDPNDPGTKLLTITGNTYINGHLVLNGDLSAAVISGESLEVAAGNAGISSAGDITGGSLDINGGTATINSSGALFLGVTSGEALNINNNLAISSNGDISANSLRVSGSTVIDSGGDISAGSLDINGGTATISSSGALFLGVTSGEALNINNNLTISSDGDITANSLSLSGGPLDLNNGASLTFDGSTVIDSSRNILANSLDIGGSTVIDSSRNISANSFDINGGTATISSSGALFLGVTSGEALNINYNLTISSDGDISANSLDVNGQSSIQSDGTITANRIDISSSASIDSNGHISAYSLSLNGLNGGTLDFINGASLAFDGSTVIDSNRNITAGSLDISGWGIAIDSNGNILADTISANSLSLNGGSLNLSNGATLTFNGGGSLDLGTGELNIGGSTVISSGRDITARDITANSLSMSGHSSLIDSSGNISAGDISANSLDVSGDILGRELYLSDGNGNTRFSTATAQSGGIDTGTAVTIGKGGDTTTSLSVYGDIQSVGNIVASTLTGTGSISVGPSGSPTATLTSAGAITGSSVTTTGDLTVGGDVTIDNTRKLRVAEIEANGTSPIGLTITGDTFINNGDLTIEGPAGTLTVAKIDGNGSPTPLDIISNTTISGTLGVNGDATINNTKTLNVATIVSNADSSGPLSIGSDVSLGTRTLTTTGAISVGGITGTALNLGSGTITTTGALSAGELTGTSLSLGSGNLTTTGTLTSGAITASSLDGGSGGISTAGAISGATVTTTGDLSVGGAAAVTGTSALGGNVTVGTTGTAATLTVHGDATISNTKTLNVATIVSNADTSGPLSIGSDVSLGSRTLTTTGAISVGSITGTGLNLGSGTVTTTGALSAGGLTGTSLSLGSGSVTTTGTLTSGAITASSLDAGSGAISTTGAISGATVTTTGDLVVGGNAAVNAGLAAGSLAVSGTSTLLGNATVGTTGTAATLTVHGDVTVNNTKTLNVATIVSNADSSGPLSIGSDVSLGSRTLTTTGMISVGAITGTALNLGSGTITTTGALSAGGLTGTSLSLGSGNLTTTGTINSGAITATSLDAGSGAISTTGAISGGGITGTSMTSSGAVKVTVSSVDKVTLGTDGTVTATGGLVGNTLSVASATATIDASGNIAGTSVSVSNGMITAGVVSSGSNNSLALNTDGTTRAFIDSTGNVGIGTSNPTSKLHVFGAITATSTITANAGFLGDGSGLTSLDAGNISSGALADARLSSNVPLKNGTQTFTGANTFNNALNSFTGDGSGLTGVTASSVAAGNVTPGNLNLGTGTITSGAITSSGAISGTSLSLGGGDISNVGTVTATSFSGSGASLTGVTASSIAAGNVSSGTLSTSVTVQDGSLSSNIPRLDATSQTFSGSMTISGSLTVSGTVSSPNAFNQTSDRNQKANFAPVNAREVLEKVAKLPIATWNYRHEDSAVRHLGPMAQDFFAAFKLGKDERYITTIDEGGVALAAIQGLHQLVQEKDARIQSLEKRLADLEARCCQ